MLIFSNLVHRVPRCKHKERRLCCNTGTCWSSVGLRRWTSQEGLSQPLIYFCLHLGTQFTELLNEAPKNTWSQSKLGVSLVVVWGVTDSLEVWTSISIWCCLCRTLYFITISLLKIMSWIHHSWKQNHCQNLQNSHSLHPAIQSENQYQVQWSSFRIFIPQWK